MDEEFLGKIRYFPDGDLDSFKFLWAGRAKRSAQLKRALGQECQLVLDVMS